MFFSSGETAGGFNVASPINSAGYDKTTPLARTGLRPENFLTGKHAHAVPIIMTPVLPKRGVGLLRLGVLCRGAREVGQLYERNAI